jgi:nitroreductase
VGDQTVELDLCIRGRRSVRSYTSEAVSKEEIEAVLEAGTWAPTGMGRQPWRFIIIEDKELIKYISEETKLLVQQMMPSMAKDFLTVEDVRCYNAPVLILICTEGDAQWDQVNVQDSILAAQNIFLKAYELGLGTCYMGFMQLLRYKPDVLKRAGVPDGYSLAVPFIVGHPKGAPRTGKREKPKILKCIK